MSTPRADRPRAPEGYGYATDPEGMLDWTQVREALAAAEVYWIGSVRPDGGPHMHSIWGGFVADRLCFEGGENTRWARNLTADHRVAFGAAAGGLHITGRGKVIKAPIGEHFPALADNYASKYDYRPETDDFWQVHPVHVIALDMRSLEAFAASPTRFTFEETA